MNVLDGAAARIKTASDLWGLHQALTEFELAGRRGPDFDFDTENELKARGVDICELPTFGGLEPSSTESIWSWDADHVLIGEGSFDEWRIMERAAISYLK